MMGEQPGKAYGLAGGLIVEALGVRSSRRRQADSIWGGVAGTQWWISPKAQHGRRDDGAAPDGVRHPFSFEFKRLAYEAVKQPVKSAA